jgi:hypothetical protein
MSRTSFVFKVSITKCLLLNLEIYTLTDIRQIDIDFLHQHGYKCKANQQKVQRRIIKELGKLIEEANKDIDTEPRVDIHNPNPTFSRCIHNALIHYSTILEASLALSTDCLQTLDDIRRNGITSYVTEMPVELSRKLLYYSLFSL